MKTIYLIPIYLFLFFSCEQRVTLPEIDISTSSDGIVELPDNVPAVFKKYFVKYTKVNAPNGKPIHILAQDGWTNNQIKHGRNVLEHILKDFPSSIYGNDKSHIANSMSNKKATMVFFNTEPDLEKAFSEGLGEATDLNMQDLRSNECPAVGSDDYINHITRDASYEEIWHLVHDYGIKPMLPKMIKNMRIANDVAAKNGWRAWPEDEPNEHPNEYIGVLIDNYYDLWKIMPTLYEGVPIIDRMKQNKNSFKDKSHFGRYFANSRKKMTYLDTLGYNIITEFFHPYLTYTPELPEKYSGVFSLKYDKMKVYTNKSQHLINVTATGYNNIEIIGNHFDNILIGNHGNNIFTGNEGNDTLIGMAGRDTVLYRGKYHEYSIQQNHKNIIVNDNVKNRDGKDVLINVEIGKFGNEYHIFIK